ncbi:DUF262 domain-containing protein, partial [Persephonella sp.]
MENWSIFEKIFEGKKIYEIPVYQRTYTWEVKQLEEFFEDLKNQPADESYFLGTFLFFKKESNLFDKFDIIDGQQRITTSIIFISTALKVLGKININEEENILLRILKETYIKQYDRYKLVPSNNNTSFFYNCILNDDIPSDTSNKAQQRLINAKKFFEKKLENMGKNDILSLLNTLRNSKVLIHIVKTSKEASQIFELVNDRGKKLTDLESIKSFLMYKVSLSRDEQALKIIEEDFGEIYKISDKLEDILKEESILSYYVIAFLNWKNQEYYKAKDFIKELVSGNKLDARTVSKDIKEVFKLSEKLITNEFGIKDLDNLKMLGRIAIFMPLFIKVYKYHSSNLELLKKIIKTSFKFALISSIAGLRSDTGVSYFYSLARDYKGNNFEKLLESINVIFEENWWNIKGRFDNNISSIYYGNLAKFILFLYENTLKESKGYKPLDINDYFDKDFKYRLSIEHIISKDIAKKQLSKEFQHEYLNLLGNLVIDYQSPNSSKGNKNFEQKKRYFNSNNTFLSQQEIIDIERELEKTLNEKFDWNNETHL